MRQFPGAGWQDQHGVECFDEAMKKDPKVEAEE